MTTMNISLPIKLKDFVDQQVTEYGFGTISEYIRELIRKDQERKQLRELLLAGAQSAPQEPVNPDYFKSLKSQIQHHTQQ